MPAIVLTCDDYRPLTENLIRSYSDFWPNHPFEFHVPYQEDDNRSFVKPNERVEMIRTPRPIRQTVLTLLEYFGDQEFIFWCIDDKFLVGADTEKLDSIFGAFLASRVDDTKLDGLAFTRARGLLGPPNLGEFPEYFLNQRVFRRTNFNGFWFPQIMRVGVLRDFYKSIPDLEVAKQYDEWKKRLPVPRNLFVTYETLLAFAESTHRGTPTVLATKAMRRRGIVYPEQDRKAQIPRFKPAGRVGGRVSRLVVDLQFQLRRYRLRIRKLARSN